VLFDENKQWTYFPPEAFLLAMGDFKKKKEVTEFSEVSNCCSTLCTLFL